MIYQTELPFSELKNNLALILNNIDPGVFTSARWFQDKGKKIKELKVDDYFVREIDNHHVLIPLIVKFIMGVSRKQFLYFIPLILTKYKYKNTDCWLEIIHKNYRAYLYSAINFKYYYNLMENEQEVKTAGNGLFSVKNLSLASAVNVKLLTENSSNTLTLMEKNIVFKTYRKLKRGKSIDIEIGEKLQQKSDFQNIPRLYGYATYEDDRGNEYSLCLLQEYFRDGQTMWQRLKGDFSRYLKNIVFEQENVSEESFRVYKKDFQRLGRVIAGLHLALCKIFGASNPEKKDRQVWIEKQKKAIEKIFNYSQGNEQDILKTGERDMLVNIVKEMANLRDKHGKYIRIHGDLHLEQILVNNDDYIILDFEGEPLKEIGDRRKKYSPLYDIAGMIRSISYLFHLIAADYFADKSIKEKIDRIVTCWQKSLSTSFLQGYLQHMQDNDKAKILPSRKNLPEMMYLLVIEKALYEAIYEINNRPDWLYIPLRGIKEYLDYYNNKENWNFMKGI